MKKIISILLLVVLCFGATMTTACTNFVGIYKEVSAEDLKAYAEEAEKHEDDVTINDEKGIKYSFELKTKDDKDEYQLDFEFFVEGKEGAKGEIVTKENGEKEELAFTFVDNYVYANYKTEDKKVKSYAPSVDLIADIGLSSLNAYSGYFDLLAMLDEVDNDVIKLSVSDMFGTKKFKFELNDESGTGKIIIVVDKDYNFKGVKLNLEYEEGSTAVDVSIKIATWNGSVKAPKDADSYKGLLG